MRGAPEAECRLPEPHLLLHSAPVVGSSEMHSRDQEEEEGGNIQGVPGTFTSHLILREQLCWL